MCVQIGAVGSLSAMTASDTLSVGLTVGTQPPLGRIGYMMRVARATGVDVAWTVDHFQGFFPQSIWDKELTFLADPDASPHPFFDYQALMGYLAPRAGRVQLAVGVTEPIRRHPVLLAQAAMTIAHMTKRPPILGIGAGEAENITPYGLDFSRPVSMLEEALEIIRLCFASRGPIDYAGKHYTLSSAVMDLAPPPDRIPELWVAAHQPRMLRLTGRFADGWYPTLPYTPETYEQSLRAIRTAARTAGRDPGAVVPGWQSIVVFGKSQAAARQLLGSRAMRFTALLAPHQVWETHGMEHPLGHDFRGMIDFVPQRFTRSDLDAAIAKVPVDLIAETVLWGSLDYVHVQLRNFIDAGLRHLVIQPISALVSKRDAAFSLKSMVTLQRRLKREGV